MEAVRYLALPPFSCRKQRLYIKKNVPRHEGMDKSKKRNIWTSQKKRNIINEM